MTPDTAPPPLPPRAESPDELADGAEPAAPPPRILHILHTLSVQAMLIGARDVPRASDASGATSSLRRALSARPTVALPLPTPACMPDDPLTPVWSHAPAVVDHALVPRADIQNGAGTTRHAPPPPLAPPVPADGADTAADTRPRWKLVPRPGHQALYSGIHSLAHAAPPTVPLANRSARDLPVSAAAAAAESDDAVAYPSVYVGAVGPAVDSTGHVIEGYALTPADQAELASLLWRDHSAVPVFLDEATATDHYEGYCKTVLWPLLHYSLWEGVATDGRQEQRHWEAYVRANLEYAQAALRTYLPGDLVFVHDYHLLLVPAQLRAMVLGRRPPPTPSVDSNASSTFMSMILRGWNGEGLPTEPPVDDDSASMATSWETQDMSIGLFLHTPFPSSELFRCLPKRAALLEAILGASLIGFNNYSFARHFVSCCTRVLGLESTPTGIEYHGRHVEIGIFPIGIDAAHSDARRRSPAVRAKTAALRELYAGKRVIVSRNKSDQLQGVVHQLLAFAKLLQLYPQWQNKVILVQITQPAAGQKDANAKLEAKVSELVAQINGTYGTIEYSPVHHVHRTVEPDDFYALLSVADVGCITSIRDGYNTVSHELIVCQQPPPTSSTSSTFDDAETDPSWAPAPLILSEFTGTAGSLSAALIVNPYDYLGVAATLADALSMPRAERIQRHRQSMAMVTKYTSPKWARSFVRALEGSHARHLMSATHTTPRLDVARCVAAFHAAVVVAPTTANEGDKEKMQAAVTAAAAAAARSRSSSISSSAAGNGGGVVPPNSTVSGANGATAVGSVKPMRLILFDYDGTLTPIVRVPSAAEPSPELLQALTALCADRSNRVFIISGRDQATLDAWLGHIPGLGLCAEHGCYLRMPYNARGWLDLTEELGDAAVWKAEIKEIFQYYQERTPGSFIEEKKSSIVWHHRLADPQFGAFQAKECQNHLENAVLSKMPLEVMKGKKNLEVRPLAINKGEIVHRLLATAAPRGARFTYVFCAGDDVTDETMFKRLRREFRHPAKSTSASNANNPNTTTSAGVSGAGSVPPSPVAAYHHPVVDTVGTTSCTGSLAGGDAGVNAAARGSQQTAVWTVTIGPASKRTTAGWHLQSPHEVVQVMLAWTGLASVASVTAPSRGASVGVPSAAMSVVGNGVETRRAASS
ncbi:trehalose-phosphatase [Allomyces macrogynus ATCC 38327]|uniref:Trehalose-phosphatase n=1 Tax=Allomyces macrogynus (strain ATCC 38327) TaxID=578462 RepID=A0A0L0SMQ6_ALLM3|nr:trehalose-phosphatase [Allomyces macrogynus ATCC 38327]|eukprot:KNE63665.1 trehalose-phosphatase [Allomyces macrogynus ATCC 38327]